MLGGKRIRKITLRIALALSSLLLFLPAFLAAGALAAVKILHAHNWRLLLKRWRGLLFCRRKPAGTALGEEIVLLFIFKGVVS